jgi:hypothetical protein
MRTKYAIWFNYPLWIHDIFPVKHVVNPKLKNLKAKTWWPWHTTFKYDKHKMDQNTYDRLIRHETGHQYQMLDGVFPAIIMAFYAEWYWCLLMILHQPILHGINWFILMLITSKYKGSKILVDFEFLRKNTAYEKECYKFDNDPHYLDKRIPIISSWYHLFTSYK